MIYILTGGPATGKGTRSDILSRELNIPHISTGEMLREVAKKDLHISAELKAGHLIDDETVTRLIEERIQKEDCKDGFVLDGYPRTYAQAILLDELLSKFNMKITKVMELVIPDELAFDRILKRQQCDNCGRGYGIDFPPKVANVCDKCGGHLSIRTDDTRDALAIRIKTYKEKSKDILEYYKSKNILMTCDASHHPETVIDDAKA